ncbi:hypothetical protein DAEQUDRAFT_662124, partial [Daedalea quercina L-15889]
MEIEAAIPPIQHHLELTKDRAAIRLNKLSEHSPILQRLPDTWRILPTSTPTPPRPTHPKITKRRTRPPASTRLCKLAERSNPVDERLEPLAVPPWRKTSADFNNRLSITPAIKGVTKEDAAKSHKEKLSQLAHDIDAVTLYSDGSLLTVHGQRRVGASHVALSNNRILFGRKIAMSRNAEVYDAEMAGLS